MIDFEQKASDIIAWQVIHDNVKLRDLMRADIIKALREAYEQGWKDAVAFANAVSPNAQVSKETK